MVMGVVKSRHLTDIANAIRSQNGAYADYGPAGFSRAVEKLDGTKGKYDYQREYKTFNAGLVDDVWLKALADAIRKQNGAEDKYRVDQMAQAIRELDFSTPRKAYALMFEYPTNARYKSMWFVRSRRELKAGDTYEGRSIVAAYTDFEDAVFAEYGDTPWVSDGSSVKEVLFRDEINPVSCRNWFNGFGQCGTFDLQKLDTSKVKNTEVMFNGCRGLASDDVGSLDMSNVESAAGMFAFCGFRTFRSGAWDLRKLKNMSSMFSHALDVVEVDLSQCKLPVNLVNATAAFLYCESLETIYMPSGCDLSYAYGDRCFSKCERLVGGNGTVFDESQCDVDMARIDGLGGRPGYFTAKG